MVDDWLTHRHNGHNVLILATERNTVAELNRLARAQLIARGDVARRSRTYKSPDDRHTITLAAGDEVILRRNQRLTQPDGTTIAVRNGMTGRVTATTRRGVAIELESFHHAPDGPASVTLPAGYVGAPVDYGYARTVDTAQGATVDHSLFAPSASATAERAYVALSRGRLSNRVYATHDRAWIDAIGPAPQPRARRRSGAQHQPKAATGPWTPQPDPGTRATSRDRPVIAHDPRDDASKTADIRGTRGLPSPPVGGTIVASIPTGQVANVERHVRLS